jgi:hypothetical protein
VRAHTGDKPYVSRFSHCLQCLYTDNI